jgi:hypothetical protein
MPRRSEPGEPDDGDGDGQHQQDAGDRQGRPRPDPQVRDDRPDHHERETGADRCGNGGGKGSGEAAARVGLVVIASNCGRRRFCLLGTWTAFA